MEMISWPVVLLLVLVLVFLIWGITTYNALVKRKNYRQEAWSGINVFLKKRYDLVPNLVETVKGYAAHEKEALEQVTVNRTLAMKAAAPGEKQQMEQQFTRALGNLIAVAESYPDLKASEGFRQLQTDLRDLETEIETARRYYNATVRDNNVLIESFPSSIIAGVGRFDKGVFFEPDDKDYTQMPQVSF